MTKPTADQITALLQHRHPAPEWASFVQLPSNTGGINRYLDFYAFNLWPSKRFIKVAYEIKVSRGDFHRELDNPRKREFAEEISDECYFATPSGLVKADEVPEGWGLIEMTTGGLRVKKRAAQGKVDQLPMAFVASLARRSSDPPATLPAAIWLVAGQEVDQKRLLTIASDEVKTQVNLARQQAVREYINSNDCKKRDRLRDLVRQHIGWQYAEDPEKLAEYLAAGKEDRPVIPAEVKAEIDRLEENIREFKRKVKAYELGGYR